MSTIASIASAMGVARMPTQGSWRPVGVTSTGSPFTLTVWPGRGGRDGATRPVERRLAEAERHAARHHVDARTDRIAVGADFIHVLFQLGNLRGVRWEESVQLHRAP